MNKSKTILLTLMFVISNSSLGYATTITPKSVALVNYQQANNWYDDIISDLENTSEISNVENLDSPLSRGEMAHLLCQTKLFGEVNNTTNPFCDMKPDDDFYDDICVLYNQKIYYGESNGNNLYAKANDILTREQTVTFLVRAFGLRYSEFNHPHFYDYSDMNIYSRENIEVCQNLGIVSGYDNYTFIPQKSVTKAEFLVMLYNTCNLPIIYQGKFYGQLPIICKDVTFEIVETQRDFSLANEQLELKLKNSSTANYKFDSNYLLEMNINEEWHTITALPLGSDSDLCDLFNLPAKSELTVNLNLKELFGALEAGTYRLTIEVYPEGLSDLRQKAICTFTIN